MLGSLNLTKLMNEDETTNNPLFHCSVCDVCFCSKSKWISHADGRAHNSKELRVSNIRDDVNDICLKLISRSKLLLGDQNKFVEIVTGAEENLCSFACILCDVKVASYFALSDHLENGLHRTKVRAYQLLKEKKDEISNSHIGEASSRRTEIFDMESVPKVNSLNRKPIFNPENVECAVKDVCDFFCGVLKCTNCQQFVELVPSTITNHLKECLFGKSPTETALLETDIRSKFLGFLKTAENSKKFDNLQIVLNQPSFQNDQVNQRLSPAAFRYLQADSIRVSAMTPDGYKCLDCNVTGSINKWEDHVMKHHVVLPNNSPSDRHSNNIVCVCTLCGLLFFGRREDVIKHEHFGADRDGLFFLFSSYPPLKQILNCNHQLPRYYKFLQKVTSISDSKQAFYCLSCDFYGIDKLKKHFQSKDHQGKSHPMFDFYYCTVCAILFYADRLLFEDHRRTPCHILSKVAIKPNTIYGSVDFISKGHEELLSNIKPEVLKYWASQPQNNLHFFINWCEYCAYSTDNEEQWRNVHLNSESHTIQPKKESFEHVCVTCKVNLFGCAEFHALHSSSEGHKNIKNQVIRNLNRRCMVNQRSIVRLELGNDDEKQVVDNVTKLGKETSDGIENANNKPSTLESTKQAGPAVNEKSYDLQTDPYMQKLSRSVVVDQKLVKDFFEKIIEKHGPFGRVRSYFCAFCSYYSSEKSWWLHLESAEHKALYSSEPKNKKKNKHVSIIIFCSLCSLLGLGDHAMRRIHINSKTHKQKCAKVQSTKNVTCNLSPISFLSTTDDDEENLLVVNGRQQVPNISHSNEAVLADAANTNLEETNSSDDEKDEVGNAEDELYDMIMREGSDVEKIATSDDELDKSVLTEMKNNAALNTNTAQELDKDDNETENREITDIEYSIVVSGIPKPVMKNRVLLREAFAKYVQFDRTFVKKNNPGSIHLVVSKDLEGSFQRLKENIVHLMARWGTDELSVHLNSEEKSELLGIREHLLDPTVLLFSNRNELINAIYHMMNRYDTEANSSSAIKRINELQIVISRLAAHIYRDYNMLVKTHIFGSRVTGLAAENSDVDIYLQIGASFRGLISNNTDLQQQLVVLFSKEMRSHPYDFCDITSIPFARVPIIKFKHIRSNLNCDLSFKSGLSTMNSILVKTYLELDERIKFVVCAVKLWMKLNDLADRNLFTTYAQIWMVLFFLMQADIAVVPTVVKLKNMLPPEQQILTVEGWNCSFPGIRNIMWRSSCSLTGEELLCKFFAFYSDISLSNYVLCTLTGLKLEKKHFVKYYDSLPEIFRTFKLRIMEDRALFRKVMGDFESFCIQDPFDHCHNLTKTINLRKFTTFVELCKQTTELLQK